MTSSDIYSILLILQFGITPILAYVLVYVRAPYGRYFHEAWGPRIGARNSWLIMESAAILAFAVTFFHYAEEYNVVNLLFFTLWQMHYVDRAVVYPSRLSRTAREMPLVLMMLGFLFNMSNGFLNAYALTAIGPEYTSAWLSQPSFLVGVALFAIGFVMNRYADTILLNLRKSGETGYKVPRGPLFDLVSCPNYLGEIVEWFGWALATWSLAGLAFALFTAANLIPRAYMHHRWYQSSFADYPSSRRAIVPFLF